MYSRYLKIVIVGFVSTLSIVATLNYMVDPGGIYQGPNVSPNDYAEKLLTTKTGLLWPSGIFPDRDLSVALTNYSENHDCIVIGSSHVMQISSSRKARSLASFCQNILNLGVAGASLEDHITLAFLAIENGARGKLIFGVDPWTLAYNKDQRWLHYEDYFCSATDVILGHSTCQEYSSTGIRSTIANLVNLEYTIRSLEELKKYSKEGPVRISVATKIDEENGGIEPVKLPDGSHIYSSAYIQTALIKEIPIGGTPYKTSGEIVSSKAVIDYENLINWVKSKGAQPILLMTPYHQNVWKDPNSQNVKAMLKTANEVFKLGDNLAIPVIGSYNPADIGCKENEFFDFMHPKASCLARIQ